MITERPAAFAASDGVGLEGLLAVPPGAPAGVVLCHPHPLYGGDMDSAVVVRAAEACTLRGLATLRFNFRGVGGSDGVHGGGDSERGDVAGALAHLRAALGGTPPVALLGYSFGAVVSASRAVEEPALAGLALVAPPLGLTGPAALAALGRFDAPLLVAAGSRDTYCPAEMLAALAATLPRATVRTIDGADHFFGAHGRALASAVDEWVTALLEAGQARRRGGAG